LHELHPPPRTPLFPYTTLFRSDETVTTKCLLIATGVEYRRLNAERCEQFEGRGVYYAATHNEAQVCKGAQVVLVGGGNSAGQARSEEHTSELQSRFDLVCRLLL